MTYEDDLNDARRHLISAANSREGDYNTRLLARALVGIGYAAVAAVAKNWK